MDNLDFDVALRQGVLPDPPKTCSHCGWYLHKRTVNGEATFHCLKRGCPSYKPPEFRWNGD